MRSGPSQVRETVSGREGSRKMWGEIAPGRVRSVGKFGTMATPAPTGRSEEMASEPPKEMVPRETVPVSMGKLNGNLWGRTRNGRVLAIAVPVVASDVASPGGMLAMGRASRGGRVSSSCARSARPASSASTPCNSAFAGALGSEVAAK